MRSLLLKTRLGVRGKALLATALIPALLAGAVLLTVHRNVRTHVESSGIHENLEHGATVLESFLEVRLASLAKNAQVIASDPRFFSLVMLSPAQRDPSFDATLVSIARDFHRPTDAELFEVFDRQGRRLAAVGSRETSAPAREPLVREALAGHRVLRAMADGARHYQVAVVPVMAEGRVMGALLIGLVIDPALAGDLKSRMRGDVTFFSAGHVTGTTLPSLALRRALAAELAGAERDPEALRASPVRKVTADGHAYLTVLRPIPGSEAEPPQLYAFQRSNDAETVFLRHMQRDMLVLGALAVLIALVTGWVFGRKITGPVLALVEGARAMQRGDFEAKITVRSRDELGYLAERFEAMREHERSYVENLREAARVKSEFLTVASHELRTPISVIQGYRDLIANGSLGEVTTQQEKALHAIREGLARLVQVAEIATQVAKIHGDRLRLDLREAPMAALVQRAIGTALSAGARRHVEVRAEMGPDLGAAWVDEARLEETLVHLIANGIRFTPDGGRVSVTGDGDGEAVVIAVRDTGVGIAPERLEQLYGSGALVLESANHHSSAHLEFNSAGLGFGVAIARAIVEAHGGTIRAESTPGAGTTVTLRLPRAGDAQTRDAA